MKSIWVFRSILLATVLFSGVPRSSDAVAAHPLSSLHQDQLPEAHPHRIIVKYRPSVSVCAHCLLAGRAAFANVTGNDSLDRLNDRFRVRTAVGLFSDDHGRGERAGRFRNRLDATRARFPERARRRPAGSSAPDLSNVFVLDLGRGSVAEAVAAFAADPDVEYAEADYIVRTSQVPNDPYFSSSGSWGRPYPDLWGLHTTEAAAAWDVGNGADIVVAVLDTGTNLRHPDIKNNLWTNPGEIPRNHVDDDGNGFVDDVYGWDFWRQSNIVKDLHGHGTHVAGTIAATGNNELGVIGMAWGTRIMTVRGFDSHGKGRSSDLAKGMLYAVANGADVLNNSWAGFGSYAVDEAIAAATDLGVIVVFAAGNESRSYLGQAANPQVIAVAATDADDLPATFSNYGPQISLAAPGVDILSLKGAGRVGGKVVGSKYRVLTGTSMAAPHASGAVALLLANQPSLSVDEVRWHLELNADQLGYAGYEGQLWNPYLGYGRLNAGRVFNTPPITTRSRTAPIRFHALRDTVVDDVASLDILFTTKQTIGWTAAAPPWLMPTIDGGTGPATLPLTSNTSGMAAGAYSGALSISAPAAVDGGVSIDATAYVHQDHRIGDEIMINPTHYPKGGAPVVASDGQGALVVWIQWHYNPDGSGEIHLKGAYVDDDGTVTGPFLIDRGVYDYFATLKSGYDIAVTAGNGEFLVLWSERLSEFVSETSLRTRQHTYVKAVRITRQGQILDVPAMLLAQEEETENSTGGFDRYLSSHAVEFDGSGYTAMWRILDFGSGSRPVEIFLRYINADGSLRPLRSIYPADWTTRYQAISPNLACVTGSCLFTFVEADGETDSNGHYLDKMYGWRFVADQPVDPAPVHVLTDVESVNAIDSDGSGYFAVGWRPVYQAGPPRTVGYDLVGARITGAGVSLDPSGIRLNNSAPEGSPTFLEPRAVSFDGTNYNVLWTQTGPQTSLCYAFVARVDRAGTVLDSEPQGLLMTPRAGIFSNQSTLVRTATKSLLVWDDVGYEYIRPTHIRAQGVLSRAAGD